MALLSRNINTGAARHNVIVSGFSGDYSSATVCICGITAENIIWPAATIHSLSMYSSSE